MNKKTNIRYISKLQDMAMTFLGDCPSRVKKLIGIFIVLIPYPMGGDVSTQEIGAMSYAGVTQVTR